MRNVCHDCSRIRRRAFTLMELVIVLLLIAIIAAVATPRYAQAVDHYQADMVAMQLVADLAYAQQEARRTSQPREVRFFLTPQTYTLVDVADLNDPSADYTREFGVPPLEADLVSVDFGGISRFTFGMYGTPSESGTIVISRGNQFRKIAVSANGRIEVSP